MSYGESYASTASYVSYTRVKPACTLPKSKAQKRIQILSDYLINEVYLNQAYYWTKHWQQGEKEADKDIAEGKFDTFSSVEDAIGHLHSLGSDENNPD